MSKEKVLKNNWKILKFSECIEQLNTGLNPRNHFSLGKGNIKYITAKNLTKLGTIDFSKCDFIDEKAKFIINRRSDIKIGDILFSSRAPIGHCHLIKAEPNYFDIGESIFSIRVNKEIVLPEYLCLYLSSDYFIKLASKNTTGSIIQEIRISDLMNTDIIIPPKDTQKCIAESILNVDKKIELNNKINAELEAMAKTIYDYWFLQFEFPNEDGKPYKSSGGKMVWNEELKREIPEIFQNLLLKEIKNISVITGKTPSTKDETNFGNEVPFITIEDLRENVFVVNTKRKLSKKGANAQEKKYIPSGSICVSCIATIGEIAITTETSQTNQQINSVICGREEIRNYLYFYLKNIFLNFKVKSGNIFSNMNKEEFESVKILLPTENILVKFSKIISLILSKIEVNTKENQELTSLRDFLLPLLMNGQVGFKEE